MPKQDYASRKITGKFIGQIYKNDRDDYPLALDPVEFDATEAVLSLFFEDLQDLAVGCLSAETVDELVPTAVRDAHGGPFYVDELEMSVAEFFDLKFGEEITREQYESARRAHRIGEVKTYRVLVERTEVQQVWVEVEASSSEQAQLNALDEAGNIDFRSEGQTCDPEYSVSDFQVVTVENESPSRPRPRG